MAGLNPKDILNNANAPLALTFFQRQGWSPAQASGIVANLFAESGIDPAKLQNDVGPGYGVAQWEHPRQQVFQDWAQKPIQGSSLYDQMGFVQHELKSSGFRSANTALQDAQTPADAALAVRQYYEKPADSDPYGANAMIRQRAAQFLHDAAFPPEDDDDAPPQPVQVTAQPVAPQPVTPSMFPMPRLST